jgi:hypothetical protein
MVPNTSVSNLVVRAELYKHNNISFLKKKFKKLKIKGFDTQINRSQDHFFFFPATA